MTGRVTNVTDYGAFVELEGGVEGLVHVSEMSWSKKIKNPAKVVSPGDTVEAIVSDVNPEARRISLSLKDTLPDPWESVAEKYAVGSRVSGKVRNLTDFGAFVEIEEGIDGLVHVSDMSWTRRIKHPSEVLKKGDDVEAMITSVDQENRRISLSIKEFQPNDWQTFKDKHQPGDVVEGDRHPRRGFRRLRPDRGARRGPHARLRDARSRAARSRRSTTRKATRSARGSSGSRTRT